MHFDIGNFKKKKDPLEVKKIINNIRLLKNSELRKLFPDGNIYQEKFFYMTKSFIIYK